MKLSKEVYDETVKAFSIEDDNVIETVRNEKIFAII